MTTQKVCDVCGTVCDGENEGIALSNVSAQLPAYSPTYTPVTVTFTVQAAAGKDNVGNQRDICRSCAWKYVYQSLMPRDLADAGFPVPH